MEQDDRMKWAVFQGATTYQNDYRKPGFNDRKIYKWPQDTTEPPTKPCAPYHARDTETFIPWRKGVHVPFDLLWKPKPILGTHPNKKIKLPDAIIDDGKEEAIKTRPRIYMKSAVSIDDVPDPEMRKFVCQALYTTESSLVQNEAAGPVTARPIPETALEGNISFKIAVETCAQLPDGWRNKSEEWDKEQIRATVDTTRAFWENSDLSKRSSNTLEDMIPENTKSEITSLIAQEKLRMPHDYPPPGYTGYKPNLAYGVPLRKKEFEITHPMMSTSQAITKRYAEDKMAQTRKT